MPQLDINRMDTRVKWWLLIVSLCAIAFLVAAAMRENVRAEWLRTRLAYKAVLADKAVDERGQELADQFEVRIVQNVLPDLDRIDRCITCHAGVDDPRMIDQPEPFRTHPGAYLLIHPPSKMGCTICHDGQGLATESRDAHGRAPFWDYPLLKREYTSTTCTRCHSRQDLEGPDGFIEQLQKTLDPQGERGLSLLNVGRELVQSRGCLGCHMLNGKGGNIGPDISHVGDKTHHELDFSHLGADAPREIAYWLEQHFLDPSRVSPDTVMPASAATPEEASALTAYMLSLRSEAPASFERPKAQAVTTEHSGAELYGMYCASCHGVDGKSDDVPHIRTPSLNNVDTLASADDDYLRHVIKYGRAGTQMPAWGLGAGGLSHEDIDKIVAHIRGWEAPGAKLADVSAARGDAGHGRAYYEGQCANCHALEGEGDIGNALNIPSFLAIASDDFLAESIISGRPGTAMASWRHLSAQTVSDLVAYLRSWQPEPPPYAAVLDHLLNTPEAEQIAVGEQVYAAKCAACHGASGEGGVGVTLNTPELLRVADNAFFYETIVEGRSTTAMPAWPDLSAAQIASLITTMRSWQPGREELPAMPGYKGDYAIGKALYDVSCIRCHGADGRGASGPQLANPQLLGAASDELLYHWIAHGRTGTAMKGFLAEEQGVTQLRPGQIVDIIAYLHHAGAKPNRPILRSGIGNPHVGADIFQGNCAACHGEHGEGGSGPQLNNPSFLRSASDGFLAATIVMGRTGTPMRSMVHGQAGLGQIEPSQVDDVIAFMRQWEFPVSWRKPRAVAEMSKRAIMSGRDQYAQLCASCHGKHGLGEREGPSFFAPSLNNADFLEAVSDGFLLSTIARGRSRTPMRPFGKGAGGIAEVDGSDISDIVSYIRSWQQMEERERRALVSTEEQNEEW